MDRECRIIHGLDGFLGMWKKMDNCKDGYCTQGIKALSNGRDHWHGLQSRRGYLVSIKDVQQSICFILGEIDEHKRNKRNRLRFCYR